MKIRNYDWNSTYFIFCVLITSIAFGCDEKPKFPLEGTEWYGEFETYINYLDFDRAIYVDAAKADGDTCFDIQFYEYDVDGNDFNIYDRNINAYITINWKVVKDTLTLYDEVTSYKYIRTAINDSSLAAQACTE